MVGELSVLKMDLANPPCTGLSGSENCLLCSVREVSVFWEEEQQQQQHQQHQQHEKSLYSSITSMGVTAASCGRTEKKKARAQKTYILARSCSPNSDPISTTCKSHLLARAVAANGGNPSGLVHRAERGNVGILFRVCVPSHVERGLGSRGGYN